MFFCEDCRLKNSWPIGISASQGTCEVCGTEKVCYDVPSRNLPQLKKETATIEEPFSSIARRVVRNGEVETLIAAILHCGYNIDDIDGILDQYR